MFSYMMSFVQVIRQFIHKLSKTLSNLLMREKSPSYELEVLPKKNASTHLMESVDPSHLF
jgi:hypothetical protein